MDDVAANETEVVERSTGFAAVEFAVSLEKLGNLHD